MIANIKAGIKKYIKRNYPNWDVSVALRYLPIVEDIKNKYGKNAKVLDVGSGEFGLAVYSNGNFKIVSTDINPGDKKRNTKIIKASADDLPFKKDFFDAVVSVDMMEHLSEDIRKKAIQEMIRVSKKCVYLSFPRGKLSEVIDKMVGKYYKFTHGSSFPFLEEHRKYGLPKERTIENYIKTSCKKYNKPVDIKKKGNTNTILWLILLFLGFSERRVLTGIFHKSLIAIPVLKLINIWPTYRVSYSIRFK